MGDTYAGYAELLHDAGLDRKDIVVIDVGLASSMQTQLFATAFPDRYFNLGIAEQNAVSVASGLARRGFIPFVHTFSNFIARRAHDQVALSVAWPGCNVKLIGGSCGLFDGRNGPSHFASDDLATVCALPGMFVAEAGDRRQLHELLQLAVQHCGPAYLRLQRHRAPGNLLPGLTPCVGTVIVRPSQDPVVTIISGGSMLNETLLAANILADHGIVVDLLHVSILKPLDVEPILESVRKTRLGVVVENHSSIGGFGDAVSREVGPLGVRQLRYSLPDAFLPAADSDWLLALCELDGSSLARRIERHIQESSHV